MGSLIACHECDLIHRIGPLPKKGIASCVRCGSVLYRDKPNSLERTLALSLAGLILFTVANAFPFLALKMGSQVHQTTLITGIKVLYTQGMQPVAILVLLTTILAPLAQLLGMLYVIVPLRHRRVPPKFAPVFRLVRSLQPWSMMEVFMLGILVSVVKLAKMAQILPGIAIFSFFALIVVLAAATVSLDPHEVWERWEKLR
ncbi:MAG: paraquat-inducible protein A [Desulfobacterales bacterium]|nr:MAG: paraquat-inducible protein A [Desulfobacterales bacterium]